MKFLGVILSMFLYLYLFNTGSCITPLIKVKYDCQENINTYNSLMICQIECIKGNCTEEIHKVGIDKRPVVCYKCRMGVYYNKH